MICAACQADFGRPERLGRRDTCPQCGGDLRTCRQCRHYDPRIRDGCREPQAERVPDPSRANFCEYFSAAETLAVAAAGGAPVVGAAGATARARAAGDTTSARDALERLFKR